MGIFQKSVIQKHLSNLDKELVEKAFQKFRENYNLSKIEKIKELKEEEYQDGFLRDLFVDVFGYTLKPDDNFNLAREFKNQGDGKKADGAILNPDRNSGEKAVAVIELKSTKTKDLKSITEQAFNYKNNQPDCKYVITSNFQKLRFYIDYANDFEEFDLFHLQKTDFELLFLILNSNSIFSDLPLKLKEETKFHEQDISGKLYKDYSIFKNRLFENLIKNNPDKDKLTLFNKSQKLLDRFLFILFAEDSGLLPPNSISRIVKRFEVLKEEDAYKLIYDIYKQYFGYMNIGRKGKTTADDIPAYNGGLFYPDELLDNLKIDDEILIHDLLKLSEYDFNTEVDVNILGHIFEHSLSEIEEITAEIEGTATDKTKSKRKKDGVFYTPKYITQYIVENTIGTLCNEKRTELEIEEIEFDGTYRTKGGKLSVKGKKLYQKLTDYKDWMLSLKIVDPACGSGAFLNQALNFLIQEHKNIDDIIAELTNTALRLFDTEKSILENNLFGVDINEESVEIAKLSLWLRTAHKDRKLSNLNNNIKCGNSLIDDPEVANDKAFDWAIEFKGIMQNGGFDVVIGNPPYLVVKGGRWVGGFQYSKEAIEFLKMNFETASQQINTYALFLELGLQITKFKGIISQITPNTFFANEYSQKLRNFLTNKSTIVELLNSGIVFDDASVETAIITYRNIIKSNSKTNIKLSFIDKGMHFNLHQIMSLTEDSKFLVNLNKNTFPLLFKLNKCDRVIKYAKVWRGLTTGNDKKYLSSTKDDEQYKHLISGSEVDRFFLLPNKKFVKYIPEELDRPRDERIFLLEEKLISKFVGNRLTFCLDDKQHYVVNTACSTEIIDKRINPLFLLSILNAKLLNFYFQQIFSDSRSTFPIMKSGNIESLPFIYVGLEKQKPFIDSAKKISELSKRLQESKNRFLNRIKDNFEIGRISKKLDAFYDYNFKTFIVELKKQKIKLSLVQQDEWEEYFNTYKNEINQLQNEIYTTDKEIDQMVYELYGLTDEEIEIIEKNN